MAFDSTDYILPQAWERFTFFKSTAGNGKISESIAPARKFKIEEIRLHNSVAFVSTEYLKVYLSAAAGSAHNLVLISIIYSNVTDYRYTEDPPGWFQSGDQLVIELSTVSGTNVIGLNVIGWAVSDEG